MRRINYKNTKEGRFLNRPNRFIAQVEIDGVEETVHVKNTGRCRELTKAVGLGYRCVILFVIAMEGVPYVLPNQEKDPAFARALEGARAAGVEVWNLRCKVGPDRIEAVDCLCLRGDEDAYEM